MGKCGQSYIQVHVHTCMYVYRKCYHTSW